MSGRHLTALLVLCLGLAAGACQDQPQQRVVTIFHAASLTRSLGLVEKQLEADNPDLDLRLEASGSMTAARKISELNRRADLVLAADHRVLEDVLVPAHADWVIRFAGNEMVLAHGEHSAHTAEIDAENWTEILLQDGVRLGRANERTAPAGVYTLAIWRLAEQGGKPGLARKLTASCRPEHVVPDVGELVSLLEARAIDYAFVFRSLAEEHNLKVVPLPPEINQGQAIAYGLAIPRKAPEPAWAERVAAFILSPAGRAILARSGFTPLAPPLVVWPARAPSLPRSLRPLVQSGDGP